MEDMSLKAFHVLFITLSCLLCFGCGAWQLTVASSPDGASSNLYIGLAAIVAGLALIAYEYYFLKKTKNVSFL
jgi:hypothetical protein